MRSLAAAGKRLSEEQKRKWNLYKRWVKCFNEKREEIVEWFKINIKENPCSGIAIYDLQDEKLYISKCFPFDVFGNNWLCDFCNCLTNSCGVKMMEWCSDFQGWFVPKFVHVSPIYPVHTVPLKPFVFLNNIVMPWEIWVVRKDNSVLIDDLLLLRVGVLEDEYSEQEEYKFPCEEQGIKLIYKYPSFRDIANCLDDKNSEI